MTSRDCAWCGETGEWKLYGIRRMDLQLRTLEDHKSITTTVLMSETLFFCTYNHRETYYFGM